VRADRDRLEQVFLNLLVNAAEHGSGTGSIDVAVRSNDGRAEVTIRDHGAGVAAEDIRTMFDAYTRLGHPQRSAGLGLGLFVAREIVTAHGGEIDAVSRVGKGTTLTVRMPLAERRAKGGRRKTPSRARARGTSSSH
jgi:signal transduction histidine kinase